MRRHFCDRKVVVDGRPKGRFRGTQGIHFVAAAQIIARNFVIFSPFAHGYSGLTSSAKQQKMCVSHAHIPSHLGPQWRLEMSARCMQMSAPVAPRTPQPLPATILPAFRDFSSIFSCKTFPYVFVYTIIAHAYENYCDEQSTRFCRRGKKFVQRTTFSHISSTIYTCFSRLSVP